MQTTKESCPERMNRVEKIIVLKYEANNFETTSYQYVTVFEMRNTQITTNNMSPDSHPVTDDVSTTKLVVIILMTYGNVVTVISLSWVIMGNAKQFQAQGSHQT